MTSRLFRRSGALGALLALLHPGLALASDLGSDGYIHFAPDALATFGFESDEDTLAAGARWIRWKASYSQQSAKATAASLAAAEVTGEDAVEGHVGLRLGPGSQGVAALALGDEALFASLVDRKVTVSMWGHARGAEPALVVVYGEQVGPYHTARVEATRTGRETSDGWAEYATGAVPGQVWGFPIKAIYLTARFATASGSPLLTDYDGGPDPASLALDPGAEAVIDAVEVRPAPGSLVPASACTAASSEQDCGPEAECFSGHCVDSAVVWGAAPVDPSHIGELVDRTAFVMRHLSADRQALTRVEELFSDQQTAALKAATGPRALLGALHEKMARVRDAHTLLGYPPSSYSVFEPAAREDSAATNACFGLVRNDISDDGKLHYAVFRVTKGSYFASELAVGDVLTAIDGQEPDAWLDKVWPRFATSLPNDAASDPAARAVQLASLLGRYARTVTLSRCAVGGGCVARPPIEVGEQIFTTVQAKGSWTGGQLLCDQRFHPSVSSPPASFGADKVVVEKQSSGETNVQFDGFATTDSDAWMSAWQPALEAGGPLLVDARYGHGGRFRLGQWLFAALRTTADPSAAFVVPRGTDTDPDPGWLLDASWDVCEQGATNVPLSCQWAGQIFFTPDKTSLATTRIAWLNTYDFSMSDYLPRLLAGGAQVRIFGPHPTIGAYGEISAIPPVIGTWRRGYIQVLDSRFGSTLAAARAAGWESGHGVVPDQIVVQTVSDILQDKDTLLDAARAWLLP